MAKARWLKPEFFTDPKVSALSDQAALLYPALWVESDDGGVAPGDPRIIYGRRFITRPTWTVATVETALVELIHTALVHPFTHKRDNWVWIPRLMPNQGTRPKDWRHLGADHAQVIERESVSFQQNAERWEKNGAPTQSAPKQLLEPEASAVTTEAALPPAGEKKTWSRALALDSIVALCYRGQRPPDNVLSQDMKWWKFKELGGEHPDRIVAALRGAPIEAAEIRNKDWSPARWFSKQGPWVNLYERSIVADGKSGRPRSAGELFGGIKSALEKRPA